MASSSKQDINVIHKLLTDRSVPLKEEHLAGEGSDVIAARQLYDEVLAIRETLKQFANGELDAQITGRGAVWGHLKTLQANLLHLAWQVEQVAEGDFSQRVDFMGSFATSFNKMVLQLDDSQEKMREAAELTQITLDALPLSCSVWNEQYEIIDCNLEAVKLYEVSSKQEYFERFFELSPQYQPDGRLSTEILREKFQEAFEKGRAELRLVRQTLSGKPIPTEVTFVRIQRKNHRVVACYSRDLRELQQKQAALDLQRLLLIDIINTSPICFMILVDGKIKFSSTFTKHFLGLEIGDFFVNCFADQGKGNDLLSRVKGTHIKWEPVTIHTKAGEAKEMLADLFPTEYSGERGVIVWLMDITEIRKVETDLRAAKARSEFLGHVKDDFIANISHELRTPMNALFSIIYLLRHTDLSEEQTSYIGIMEESAKNLSRIINDMLDFSHIESGKVVVELEIFGFEIRRTLASVWRAFQEAAQENNLSLSYSVDDDVPDWVTGDPVKLQQILVILTDNAIKFTSHGAIHIQAQLESSMDDHVMLFFSVQDTGAGIDAEYVKHVFEPFSQADISKTRKYGGVGLGLSIAKSLVEVMGGRIWCESEVQQGSTFFFTVAFGLPNDDSEAIIFSDTLRKLPILLVEDNKINQIVATKMLQEKEFHVEVAPNGLKAIEMLRQKKYALVLMDIQMPEMDGLQATREIRRDPAYKSLPIIALTANAMEDDRKQCLEAGMNDHLAKPIDPKLLYQAILKWTKNKSAVEP